MRRATTLLLRAALVGAALYCGGAAHADPVAPTVLVPALDLYVDAEVAAHNLALSCADAKSPARDDAAWQKATAVFIATLWANGFPDDFVKGATVRFAAPAKPADCSDHFAMGFSDAERNGWEQAVERVFGALDLTVVSEPVPAETWTAIKAAIAAEIPRQSRMMECVGVTYPTLMPTMVHDWDQMIVQIGGKLVAVGLPRDEIAAALSPLEANAAWRRAPADKVADLAQACAADSEWQTRFNEFDFLGLGDAIDKLLPQPPPDSDQ